jgi:hypothetical protein
MKLDVTFVFIDLASAIMLIPTVLRGLARHSRCCLLPSIMHFRPLARSAPPLVLLSAFLASHSDCSGLDFSSGPLPGVTAHQVILNRPRFVIAWGSCRIHYLSILPDIREVGLIIFGRLRRSFCPQQMNSVHSRSVHWSGRFTTD